MSRQPALSRKTILQFWRIAIPFFRSDAKKRAYLWLGTLLALMVAVNVANVRMSYANRDMMTALTDRKGDEFYVSLWIYIGTFAISIPVAVLYRYAEERLALLWREWMTKHMLKKYLLRRSYYRLRSSKDIDNPDQRISEDIRNFTATTLSLFLICLSAAMTLVAFIGVLSSISWSLVLVLFAYALAGTIGTFVIGRKLVKLHYRQYRQEANFRYGLVRIRDNAESIAFFRGEPREWIDLKKKVAGAIQNTLFIMGWNRNLGFFTTSYNYVALVVPVMIVAPMYLRNQVPFGVIPQAAGAFAQVLAAMSLLITQFERVSDFFAGVTRLSDLWITLEAYELADIDDDPTLEFEDREDRLKLKEVTVWTPNREKKLIEHLSFAVRSGKSLLITGESGTGKSSLLRTIAGIWVSGEGAIERPKLAELMFLPQRPYMIIGTLRAQLQYPSRERESDASDEKLRKILDEVNLSEVLERVDGKFDRRLDWTNVLSLGEQQRASFARLLYRGPKLAFLDEATSALDEKNEARLYGLIRDMGISFVSVGHRSSLFDFHDQVLTIMKDGSWKIGPARSAKP